MLKPIITEKSFQGVTERNQYSFKVSSGLNKNQIKKKVEEAFKVKVVKVKTASIPGKKKRRGRFYGKTSGYKKAVVSLKKGDKIEEFKATK